jgi:uncharacterized protein (TIGR02594 family)
MVVESVMFKFADIAADYKKLWEQANIRPDKGAAVESAAKTLRNNKSSYDEVSAITGVPWFVVGVIHSLEASFRMDQHLHNGDPLTARTVHVPAGRPARSNPPFTWVQSAVDALTMHGMQNVGKDAWSIERVAYELEKYNGFGYRKNHPEVNTPYLWSCTNQYTKGKYIADHQFDPNVPSRQVGAMAILKQLVAEGETVLNQAALPPPPPPPPPVPVPTGLFFADTLPFDLREQASKDSTRLQRVMTDMPVRKIEDAPVPPWWKVEAFAPDGSKHIGFAQRDWLKEQTVLSSFEPQVFAQTCLDVARHYGTSAHFLIALADAETGMANTAVAGAGDAFGPFALSSEEWTANNDPHETGVGDDGRFDPVAQAAVAARLVVRLTENARNSLPDKRLATSEELYLARIFGPVALQGLLDNKMQSKSVRDALAPMVATDIDVIFARRPGLLTTGIIVSDLRDAMQKKLDAGFDKAVALIAEIEPDLVIGPLEPDDGTKEMSTVDAKDVPWMVKAKEQEALGVEEIPGPASNPEVEKYFTATPLGRQKDDVAWCAAFVSWCIKEAGGSKKHVEFSARAADWLRNGDPLSGPQYGAIVVTRPMAPKSSGHVGFVVSWDATRVKILAGNQKGPNGRDAVCEKDFHIADVRGWRLV